MTDGDDQSGARGAGGHTTSTGIGFGATRGDAVVNYFFPVTVEVRTVAAPVDTNALVDHVLGRLADSLDAH